MSAGPPSVNEKHETIAPPAREVDATTATEELVELVGFASERLGCPILGAARRAMLDERRARPRDAENAATRLRRAMRSRTRRAGGSPRSSLTVSPSLSMRGTSRRRRSMGIAGTVASWPRLLPCGPAFNALRRARASEGGRGGGGRARGAAGAAA